MDRLGRLGRLLLCGRELILRLLRRSAPGVRGLRLLRLAQRRSQQRVLYLYPRCGLSLESISRVCQLLFELLILRVQLSRWRSR